MTDTPRTDAVSNEPSGPDNIVSIYTLSRQLERELRLAEMAAKDNADWFDNLVHDLSQTLGCEQSAGSVVAAVREREAVGALPISTNRTREEARVGCGPVLRHDDGCGASHGCVEAQRAHHMVDWCIAEKNEAQAQLTTLRRKVTAAEGMVGILHKFKAERKAVQLGVPRELDAALTAWQEANKQLQTKTP